MANFFVLFLCRLVTFFSGLTPNQFQLKFSFTKPNSFQANSCGRIRKKFLGIETNATDESAMSCRDRINARPDIYSVGTKVVGRIVVDRYRVVPTT